MSIVKKKWLVLTILFYYLSTWRSYSTSDVSQIDLPLFGTSNLHRSLGGFANKVVDRLIVVPRIIPFPPNHSSYRRAIELQTYLNCAVEQGKFVREKSMMYKIKAPRQYVWNPSLKCSKIVPSRNVTLLYSSNVCSLIRSKRMLLVGDRVQYSLHNLLIHRLGGHSELSDICPGAEYCNWHSICGPKPHSYEDLQVPMVPLVNVSDSNINSDLLSTPSSAYKHAVPANWAKLNLSIIRYSPSANLHYVHKRHSKHLNEAYISSSTGVREIESFWSFWVKGSDIVVLSKPPVPAPAWSYLSSSDGMGELRGFAVRPDASPLSKLIGPLWQNITLDLGGQERHQRSLSKSTANGYTSKEIIHSAVQATLQLWLPALLTTLQALKELSMSTQTTYVWRGEWFVQIECGTNPALIETQLERIVGLNLHSTIPVKDPWSAFHNVQVLLQSQILQRLLPYHGIPYLPHYMHLAPFTSGFVGSGDFEKTVSSKVSGIQSRELEGLNCLTYDPLVENSHVEEVFLGGLARVLAWEIVEQN